MQAVVILGMGKITMGLLHPLMHERLRSETVYVACVRGSEEWKNRQKYGILTSKVIENKGCLSCKTNWVFNKPTENFQEFLVRLNASKSPGIWVLSDEIMLKEVVEHSTVIATSLGIEGLAYMLGELNRLKELMPLDVYAFENKPYAVNEVAKKYSNMNVIHCPIDKVVVSREFDDYNHSVEVRLGVDPSELIMIYDRTGVWEDVMYPDANSSVVITKDAKLLNKTIKKKQGIKNNVHKLLCQVVASDKDRNAIMNSPPCEVLKEADLHWVKSLKNPLVLATIVEIVAEWEKITSEACLDLYHELSEYFETALAAVATDSNDTLGRIIHLASDESARIDKKLLISALEIGLQMLENPVANTVVDHIQKQESIVLNLAHMKESLKSAIKNLTKDA